MKIILDTGAQIPVTKEFEQAVQKLVMNMMFPQKVRKTYTVPRIAREWTPAEEELVRVEFPRGVATGRSAGAVAQDIGVKLNRSAFSISSRARVLGLTTHRT